MKSISDDVREAQVVWRGQSKAKRLVLGSLLAGVALVLQAAGDLLPGIGYFISPFATLPILMATMLSLQMGVMAYLLTVLLLFILFPSELVIFPFTTGLLGLGVGAAFSFFKKRITMIATGAIVLTGGIMSLLYIVRFPVLGSAVSSSFSILTAGMIFLVSFFYSWLCVEGGLFMFKRIRRIIISSRLG